MAKRETKAKPKRPVVLVVVEGQSDENALTVALTEAFELKYGEDVIVHFAKLVNNNGTMGGDLTSKYGIEPEKLQMLMNKLIIIPCLNENSLMPKHVTEIVQIIDTDGAFIPDESIQKSETTLKNSSLVYMEEAILTSSPDGVADRNKRKQANILKLLEFHRTGFDIQNYFDAGFGNKPTTKTCIVPYSIYFFSCNLDHCTVGDANLIQYAKVLYADDFARKHGNDLESFSRFLQNDLASLASMSFDETWNYVRLGTNSLKRCTNIGLLVGAHTALDEQELDATG